MNNFYTNHYHFFTTDIVKIYLNYQLLSYLVKTRYKVQCLDLTMITILFKIVKYFAFVFFFVLINLLLISC